MIPLDRPWLNDTVVCVASGPSLTPEDVDYCRGRALVLVVNNSYQLAPWADALYACDDKWWKWHPDALQFAGEKHTLDTTWGRAGCPHPAIHVWMNAGDNGLETGRPNAVRTGRNSGYQAVNLAVQLGAKRILLLGYDMQFSDKNRAHWHGNHAHGPLPPVQVFIRYFDKVAPELKRRGVEVINCSRETALTCFPRQPLMEALP